MIELRRATAADAVAIAEVHIRAWRAAYDGLLPAGFLARLDPIERARRYSFHSGAQAPRTVIALEHGAIVGFATTGPSRDEDAPGLGELYALYVDPPRWGSGVGRLLMGSAYAQLRELGCSEAVLWVLVGNEAAERFYLADGWSRDGGHRHEDVWDVEAEVIRYRRALPAG